MKNIAVPDEIHLRIKAISAASSQSMAEYISVLVIEATVNKKYREEVWNRIWKNQEETCSK